MTIEKHKGIVMIIAPSQSNVIATRTLLVTGENAQEMTEDAYRQAPGCTIMGIIERPQEGIDYFEERTPPPFQPLASPYVEFTVRNWHVYAVALFVVAIGVAYVIWGR